VDKEVVQRRKKKISKDKTSSVGARKNRLSATNIEHFKQLLLEKRREILNNVNEIEGEALKKSRLDATGDLSCMPIHMADLGTDNYEQEFVLGLMDSERKLLREIDDALQRMEEGTYGICEGTGKPIPKARLEAQPWARYCVEYARMLEQGIVRQEE
jgi:DnaK suppressor protein